jgi:hypothetical protein
MEQWAFQQDGSAARCRQRLDSQLTIHLDEIQGACKLSDAQKAKIVLAGRGDMKHFFDRYEVIRRKFKPIDRNAPDFQEVWQKFWQDISPLQQSLQSSLFETGSLFDKALVTTLTAEQKARYQTLLNERRQFQFQGAIEKVVHDLDQVGRLTQAQRRRLTEFLTRETKPPRKAGPYDNYYLLWQLGRLPEARLEGMFDAVQRKAIDSQLAQARNLAQSFRNNKLWPGEDDENPDDSPKDKMAQPAKK